MYGANVDAFGSATVVDYTIGINMDVSAASYVFYFITATDFSGNEGKPAKINTLSGVGGTPTSYVLSVSNFPNPFNPIDHGELHGADARTHNGGDLRRARRARGNAGGQRVA